MPVEVEIDECVPRFFFSEPWEPIIVRRGDALGLRALTDSFADAVAPDLSNRIQDGRWVTILAWCLVRSQELFHASGGGQISTPSQQRDRYAWLRPLELMWVARTIALDEDEWRTRSLAGSRSVQPWYQGNERIRPPHFGMSADQLRRYRQTGMYGGYRLGFRKWPEMTVNGDGWRPATHSRELAAWLDKKLGSAGLSPDNGEYEPSTRSAKRAKDRAEWWLKNWQTFDKGGKTADDNTLPRRKDDFYVLPESDQLRRSIFGSDSNGLKRQKVAEAVWKANKARTHIEICSHLSGVFADQKTIVVLPRFSRLADAGMEAMDLIREVLGSKASVELRHVAEHPKAKSVCKELMEAASEFKGERLRLRHIETGTRFAEAITSSRPIECLRDLIEYHNRYGGGLRWFALGNNEVVERCSLLSVGSSRYRFRLWSLCRLAAQCGVIKNMPPALLADRGLERDEPQESKDE